MTIRLRAGGATDVGQLREINQDSLLVGPGVFVVADGMGGHQGGEVASAMAVETFDGTFGERTTVAQMIASVQDANEAVFERSGADPALSGMGTTLVAIAVVVEEGEERLGIVNVGDSRAYRLANGVLEQVSDDHSLVGEMVRDGRISPEQARDHPQKNIVTRAVGIDRDVIVDEFQLLPHAGDRYLLCSDGLTDEVDERDLAVVLRTIDDPDEAARELVRRANEHGGRDNITVVIVDVVDDGDISGAASAVVPDSDHFSDDEGPDTQTFLALPDDQAHAERSGSPPADGTADGPADGPAPVTIDDPKPRRPRAVTIRSVAFVVLVLALLGGGAWLTDNYARNTYYVDADAGQVTIFQGRPGGFLWYDTSPVEETDLDVEDLSGASRARVEDSGDFSTVDSARSFVETLETTTTTTSTTSTTTSTTTTTTAN